MNVEQSISANLPTFDLLTAQLNRLTDQINEMVARGLCPRRDDEVVGPIRRREMQRHKHLVANLHLLGYKRVDDYWVYAKTGTALHPTQFMHAWKHWSNNQILACAAHVRRHPLLARALWVA